VATDAPLWSMRAAVISVSDLDRSVDFYKDVMNVSELLREGEVVVLGPPGGLWRIYLRAAYQRASHPGRHALGARVMGFSVGSLTELDRVEDRLRARDAFRDRHPQDIVGTYDVVFGHDPDRLALTFAAPTTDDVPLDHDRQMAALYIADV
jgi:catechol 2,3-dioxygenase-like lactoylglutathione lyase family enzyme